METVADMEALRRTALKHDLLLIALFGSRVKENFREASDVDLAVLVRRPEWDNPDWKFEMNARSTAAELEADLSALFPGNEVDVSLLNGASPILMFEVARTGRPLFEAEIGAFSRFRSLAARLYYDNEPRMRRQAEYLRRARS